MDMQDSSMRKQMLFYKVSIQQKPFFDTTAQYTNTMFFNTHTQTNFKFQFCEQAHLS